MESIKALPTTWIILGVLWITGGFVYHWVYADYTHPEGPTRDSGFISLRNKKGLLFEAGVDSSKKSSIVSRMIPDLLYWPRFYAVTCLGFPAVVGLIVSLSIDAENDVDDLYFVESLRTNGGSIFVAGHCFLWVGIYFFSILPISNTFYCSQSLSLYLNKPEMYDVAPLAFNRRVHVQFGIIGSILLSLGSLILAFGLEEEITISDEEKKSLISLAAFVPALFLIHTASKGVKFILDVFACGGLRVFQYSMYFSHILVGGFFFKMILDRNQLAGAIVFSFWALLWLLPNLIWVGSSTKGSITGQENGGARLFKISYHGVVGQALESVDLSLECPSMTQSRLGLKRWAFFRTLVRPFYMKRSPTESDSGSKIYFSKIIGQGSISMHLCDMGFLLGCPCLCICCFFNICCGDSPKKKKNLKKLSSRGDMIKAIITPSVGKSIENAFSPNFTDVIVLSDRMGITKSLLYLSQWAAQKAQERGVGLVPKLFMVWYCLTLTDVLKVFKFLEELRGETGKDWDLINKDLDFVLAYSGRQRHLGFFLESAYDVRSSDDFLFGAYPRYREFVRNICLIPSLDAYKVNLGFLLNFLSSSSYADTTRADFKPRLLSFGLTSFIYQSRWMSENAKVPFDYSVEENSIMDDPVALAPCNNTFPSHAFRNAIHSHAFRNAIRPSPGLRPSP